MPFLEVVSDNKEKQAAFSLTLTLKSDANTDVIVSDMPVFGIPITIKPALKDVINKKLPPNFVFGWINYAALSKLGCMSSDQYFDANDYIINNQNQLAFSRSVTVVEFNPDVEKGKEILKFQVN